MAISKGCFACFLLSLSFFVAEGALSKTCSEKEDPSLVTPSAQALLQAHHTIQSHGGATFTADARAEVDRKAPVGNMQRQNALMKINPSGAAAPLTSEGYFAVADRCCQAEMKQFIERQVSNLNLQVCETAGLSGIVHYHTCPLGPQTFDKLTADLLADSLPKCRWLAPKSETCTKPFPEDCETFEGIEPADCGCSRSAAAKLDFGSVNIPANNLGGLGPTSGDSEIRYSSGVSSSGQVFDLVVTALGSYVAKDSSINGRTGGFGQINIKANTNTSFKFSLMAPGTNTPMTVSEVHMATFDLDGTHAWGIESVSSKGYNGYVTDAYPNVEASLDPDGRTKFTGNGAGDLKNPVDPNSLTNSQRRNTVMYFYKDVSSFELRFIAHEGTNKDFDEDTGRNIFFALESALEDRCGP